MRSRRQPSLILRSSLAFALVAMFTVSGAGWYLYASMKQSVMQRTDHAVLARLDHFRKLLRYDLTLENLKGSPQLFENMLDSEEDIFLIGEPGKAPVISVNPQRAPLPELPVVPQDVALRDTDLRSGTSLQGVPLRAASSTAMSGGVEVRLTAAHLMVKEMAMLESFRQRIYAATTLAFLITALLGYVLLRRGLRPLRRVINELTKVQRGEAVRMGDRHPRELEPLTDSINAFIESERENLDRQRNTLADLAHSLKTPLAVLRTQLDSGNDGPELREELDAQLRRMNNLVTYQLSRAASSGHKLFSAPLPIEPNAEEIVRGLEKVYAAKGVLCEFDIEPSARFHGEPGDLQELLGNLLENAFKWARRRVLLSVRPAPAAGSRRAGLVLSVEDDGPGIAPEEVAHILQRGVRGDERVQGHGIGLAIVQDLVKGYRGELQVSRSEELGGARFLVTLPPGL